MATLPPIYFLDGGMGTTLADKFEFKFDDTTPLWSSQLLLSRTGRQILQKCHVSFLEAGADLITTATYQASTREFMNYLAKRKEVQINENKSANSTGSGDNHHAYGSEKTTRTIQSMFMSSKNLSRPEKEENSRRNSLEIAKAHKYMRIAVKLARQSLGQEKIGGVVLGLGAAGACLKPSQEYTGNYAGSEVGTSISSLRKWHFERLCVFAHSEEEEYTEDSPEGVDEFLDSNTSCSNGSYNNCWSEIDLIGFETLPLLQEIIAVREAMAQVNRINSDFHLSDTPTANAEKEITQKDFWISCVFPGEGFQLPDGSSITEVMRSMLSKRENAETPIAVGINCTRIGKLEPLIKYYEAAIMQMISEGEIEAWPSLVVYPDGTKGEVYNTTTREWELKKTSDSNSCSWDEMMYDIVDRARHRGSWRSIFAGGCCKTLPDDIRDLRSRWSFI